MGNLVNIHVDCVPKTLALSFSKLIVMPAFFIVRGITSVTRCTLWPPRTTGIVVVFVA